MVTRQELQEIYNEVYNKIFASGLTVIEIQMIINTLQQRLNAVGVNLQEEADEVAVQEESFKEVKK